MKVLVTVTIFLILVQQKNCRLFKFEDTDEDSLVLVHVLFRHGDRTPDKYSIYPKDPYANETYYSVGYGQLTNEGKRTEYAIGKSLKETYRNFLGDIYTPEILDARTTDFSRTKMSLELVLAGMFPPSLSQTWSELPWQPIPYNYRRTDEDDVLLCYNGSNYKRLYQRYQSSPREQNELKKYRKTFEYISENTGLDIRTSRDVFELHFCLKTEEEWGLKLPEWTEPLWPEIITEIAARDYLVQTATTELMKLTAGNLLRKIVEDSQAKLSGTLEPTDRKLFLYSAHEMNVAHMLVLLGEFYPHVPPYGAHIIFEVHEKRGNHFIRVLYQDYKQQKPRPLNLPACDIFCPLEQFIALYEEYFPFGEKC